MAAEQIKKIAQNKKAYHDKRAAVWCRFKQPQFIKNKRQRF
jgi:hypothetical protein